MTLKTCLKCEFHGIFDVEDGKKSRCARENGWSEFSKCIANQALDRFLEQERTSATRSFSSLEHIYPRQ